MEVKNRNDGHRGAFYMEDDGKEIGLMHYLVPSPERIVIDHTVVDDAYEGKGLGRQLIKAGVLYAREHHMKIQPICPFAKKIFDITPDFADVLY
jgi:predicted GNAT family acetyltransferase